jgi:hypothetical protein
MHYIVHIGTYVIHIYKSWCNVRIARGNRAPEYRAPEYFRVSNAHSRIQSRVFPCIAMHAAFRLNPSLCTRVNKRCPEFWPVP